MSALPARAAAISTVSPLGFTACGSAPASSSARAIAPLRLRDASDSGDSPYALAAAASAPAPSSNPTVSASS